MSIDITSPAAELASTFRAAWERLRGHQRPPGPAESKGHHIPGIPGPGVDPGSLVPSTEGQDPSPSDVATRITEQELRVEELNVRLRVLKRRD
jgi:hypothetical protein